MGCEVESVTVGHRPVQGAGKAEMMRRRRSLSLPALPLATRLVFSFSGEHQQADWSGPLLSETAFLTWEEAGP